ncbi:hypothetical protein XCV3488 [Xanthomonas euvesicatoria pv. vesicatoria str. 85-10]|uniref:Uncharacterized protein n=1 Tax=Xanthomonas euvesicatoria pv. vesicatoria (strain 85-10) TaxID=316273 RepID=Q3BPU4_XANE5|nr:hypothetical protein XCV3488 [Xanthomonas euvesicatoria pv. vesicatoria str. 85-10]
MSRHRVNGHALDISAPRALRSPQCKGSLCMTADRRSALRRCTCCLLHKRLQIRCHDLCQPVDEGAQALRQMAALCEKRRP